VAPPLWDWLGEPLAIDFANTTRRRGAVERDLLETGADVTGWAERERERGRVPPVPARAAEQRLDDIRALRDDVQAVLHAMADATELPPRPVARLNALARAVPVVGQLGGRAGELRHAPATHAGAVDELLARVAAATIELVGQGEPDAVHFCDAPSCGRFFAPQRPNQRWCGSACGTRARVARHAALARVTSP
jgi:predicted RNA-binding Zn ribbon-like protein